MKTGGGGGGGVSQIIPFNVYKTKQLQSTFLQKKVKSSLGNIQQL